MENELSFIASLRQSLKKPRILLPIGDDAAAFDKFVITKDVIVENIHFTRKASVKDIIFKLFTSNVSDIAAMGAKPLYCLFAISMPPEQFKQKDIIDALVFAQNYYKITIIGGDTTSSKSDLFLSLTLIGRKNKYLLTRAGAKPGDLLFLSRPLGLALLSLENEITEKKFDIEEFYHYRIIAESSLGTLLGSLKGVNACIDISDGLGVDSQHLAMESNVKIEINEELLPIKHLLKFKVDNLKYLLNSGEEYALLFTIDPQFKDSIINEINNKLGRMPFHIGYVKNGSGSYLKKDNRLDDISRMGYVHRL